MRIIRSFIEDLCNGSTPDSDSVCGGSNPSSSAKKSPTAFAVGDFLHGWNSNRLTAICRWHIAATSSKTGGFFDFCLQRQAKMSSNPSSSAKKKNHTIRCGFLFCHRMRDRIRTNLAARLRWSLARHRLDGDDTIVLLKAKCNSNPSSIFSPLLMFRMF